MKVNSASVLFRLCGERLDTLLTALQLLSKVLFALTLHNAVIVTFRHLLLNFWTQIIQDISNVCEASNVRNHL